MIKVLKTDLFRLFRSKAFYAFPIVLIIVFSLEMVLSAVVDEGPVVETEISEMTEDGASGSENTLANATGTDNIAGKKYTSFGIRDLVDAMTDGLLLLFLGITLIMFATSESRSGFIKTAAGCVSDRGFMPVSKILIGIVILFTYIVEYAVIRFVFYGLSALASGKPLQYTKLPDGDAGKFLGYIMLCILAHIAIVALMILLYEVSHNRALGIVTVFVISAGLLGQILTGIVALIQMLFEIWKDFDISKYLLMSNMDAGYNAPGYHPIIMLVISIIYLVGGTAGAVWVAKYRDIR